MIVVTGCWSEQLDHSLSADQWAKLGSDLARPEVGPRCKLGPSCATAATLGQELFFEPALSSTGAVSCATCHDPTRWFVDTRSANNVSFGAIAWTRRNSIGLVDITVKDAVAVPAAHDVFTWNGAYESPGAVLELAITRAMNSDAANAAKVIRYNPLYSVQYTNALDRQGPSVSNTIVFANLEKAFAAYFDELRSGPSPFDAFLADQPAAISASAERGFEIFVGRGTCIECHHGSLLSDLEFHNTGVAQVGPNVLPVDLGLEDVTNSTFDAGRFLTPSLRNVAQTGPYMHDGSLATLTDVVEFYRSGGVGAGYAGVRDPRIVPLDLSDDDVRDLVAFLETLTGTPVDPALTRDVRPTGTPVGPALTRDLRP
jgi:cytochrome c peroxidase